MDIDFYPRIMYSQDVSGARATGTNIDWHKQKAYPHGVYEIYKFGE
jgi:hypothetical protein